MGLDGRETEELLRLAEAGYGRAIGGLFERHRGRLRRMVAARLEPPDRAFLELRYIERLSLGESAARLEIGPSAVKLRHLRALKRVRGLLEGPRAEPDS